MFSKAYKSLKNALDSKWFTALIIVLFVLQAGWIALSFRYPMIYDEAFHVDATRLFSQQYSPTLSSQPEYYDMYGALSHGGATLFHYLLGLPFRFVDNRVENTAVEVISLRFFCITLAALGIYVYIRLFDRLKIKRRFSNIAMLIFVMLPITTFVSATVNYDNLLLPLTGLFFLLAVRVVQSKKINVEDVILMIVVGSLATLVKFTFIPLFVVSALYILTIFINRYKKQGSSSLSIISRPMLYVSILAALITLPILFSVYGVNVLNYRSVRPSCQQVLSVDRCTSSDLQARHDEAVKAKEGREPQQLPEYTSLWLTQMINWTSMTGARPNGGGAVTKDPLPVLHATLYFGSIIALLAIARAKNILRKPEHNFLFVMTGVLYVSVFLQNYSVYLDVYYPYAVQPRYLLTVAPILIVFGIISVNHILGKRQLTKSILLGFTLLLLTQGGGITTHILKSDSSWYFDNNTVRRVNDSARSVLAPLVKEREDN